MNSQKRTSKKKAENMCDQTIKSEELTSMSFGPKTILRIIQHESSSSSIDAE